ncbi:hypothetical protein GGS21DRAFT_490036 [Xylaria nigripes]|nr:hypothetical protein GGS21DRAFT_490036 [Xylaria nigripes]
MNQAILISQRPENDARLNLSLLNTPYQRGGPPMLELPWTHPFENVGYGPRRNLRNLGKKASYVTSPDADRLCVSNDEFGIGLQLGGESEDPSLAAQGRNVGQSLDQVHPMHMAGVIPDHQYPGAEAFLGTTFSAPGEALPGSMGLADYTERSEIKQHRERNRVAARKCRQKAKKNVADLQRREKDLGRRNRMLLGCVSSLREEILVLKNEILRHSECNSNVIQNYIANAARRQLG